MHTFKSIHNGDIALEDVEKEQIELKRDLGRIKQGDPKDKSQEQKKRINNIKNLYNSREGVVQIFNDYAKNMSRNIYDSKQKTWLKILTLKQTFQRLLIAFAQIKVGNNSRSLLNKIRQIVYSLYQSKEITKKVYNNIIKLIKVSYKMDTIFMNSENSRTFEYHVLVLKLADKFDLRRGQKVLLYQILVFTIHGKT